MLAILQSGLHLYYSYDSVSLPVTQAKTNDSSEQPPKQEHPIYHVKALLPSLSKDIGIRAAGMAILGPTVYALFIRRTAWSCSLYFATLLWDVPASQLSYIPPYHYSLVLHSFLSSLCLMILWEFSNSIFSAHLVQEPMKREQPLTSESKDPNASLLLGLKAKREIIRVSSKPSFYSGKRLSILDLCILRACSHQPTLPSKTQSYFHRHRPPNRLSMESDHDSLLGQHPRHQQSHRGIPKSSHQIGRSSPADHHRISAFNLIGAPQTREHLQQRPTTSDHSRKDRIKYRHHRQVLWAIATACEASEVSRTPARRGRKISRCCKPEAPHARPTGELEHHRSACSIQRLPHPVLALSFRTSIPAHIQASCLYRGTRFAI